MTKQTEALKLALEGVEIHSPNSPEYIVCASLIQALAQTKHNPVGFYDAENKDLRREIPMGEDGDWWQPVYTHPPVPTAQPKEPEQEPVAWITQSGKGWLRWHKSYDDNKDSVPLYTTPPQRTWVGLTDEEVEAIYRAVDGNEFPIDFYKEIEAKLKEKNT